MKSIYCSWKDEEIIKFFTFVSNEKKKKPLIAIFADYARLTGRKPNSVRNYYYAEICELEKNQQKRIRLGIDLDCHKVSKQIPFEKQQEKDVIKNILKLTSEGLSVRGACLKLAQNDLSMMIRYQNKYRNVLNLCPQLIDECADELKNEGYDVRIAHKKQKADNILYMPKPKESLSDDDINALFMGLIRLVKRVANSQAEASFESQIKSANNDLRSAMVSISNKEKQIKQLNATVQNLKSENKNLSEKLKQFRCNQAARAELDKGQKMKQLRLFASTLSQNSVTQKKSES